MVLRKQPGKSSQLSQEYVEDSSDDGSDVNVSRTTKLAPQKASTTPKTSLNRTLKTPPKILSDESSDEESSDEESSERSSSNESSSSEENSRKRKAEAQKLPGRPVKKSKPQST